MSLTAANFFKHIKDINIEQIKKITLEYIVDLSNTVDESNKTPLLCAQRMLQALQSNTGETAEADKKKLHEIIHILQNAELFFAVSKVSSIDEDQVRDLVTQYGADPNAKYSFGKTPLHFAIEKGNLDAIVVLVELDADLTAATTDGETMLHAAAKCTDVKIINALIKEYHLHELLSSKTKDGTTPLSLALLRGNTAVATYLCKIDVLGFISNIASHFIPLAFHATTLQIIREFLKDDKVPSANKKQLLQILLEKSLEYLNIGTYRIVLENLEKFPSLAEDLKDAQLKYPSVIAKMVAILKTDKEGQMGAYATLAESTMQEFGKLFGYITKEGAQILAAQIKHSKEEREKEEAPYLFQPTIVDVKEIERYFKAIQKAAGPLSEKFVFSNGHWVSGQIKKDENGNIKILFVDAMGVDSFDLPRMHSTVPEAIKACNAVFGDPSNPDSTPVEIFLNPTKRQHAQRACQAFAMHDLHDLHTIGNYLEPQYKEDIFAFAQNNPFKDKKSGKSDITIHGRKVMLCDLPPPFYSIMQSEQTQDILAERSAEQQAQPMGKRQPTAAAFLKAYPKEVGFPNPFKGKSDEFFAMLNISPKDITPKNFRLLYKLQDKMKTSIFEYFASMESLRAVQAERDAFSVSAFERRMSEPKVDFSKLSISEEEQKRRSAQTATTDGHKGIKKLK